MKDKGEGNTVDDQAIKDSFDKVIEGTLSPKLDIREVLRYRK